jgi:hypothetical protein
VNEGNLQKSRPDVDGHPGRPFRRYRRQQRQQGLGEASTPGSASGEEYLHTTFSDLDREYRDGNLIDRSLPDYLHGKMQALLSGIFPVGLLGLAILTAI